MLSSYGIYNRREGAHNIEAGSLLSRERAEPDEPAEPAQSAKPVQPLGGEKILARSLVGRFLMSSVSDVNTCPPIFYRLRTRKLPLISSLLSKHRCGRDAT